MTYRRLTSSFWEQSKLRSDLAATPAQVFGVLVATTGLASFALVLALVEQVVLEVIEDNVKRGSKVYQRDHVRACALRVQALRGYRCLRAQSALKRTAFLVTDKTCLHPFRSSADRAV